MGQHSVFVDLSECRSTTLASTFQEDAHRHTPLHMQHSAMTDIYYVWHAVCQTCSMSDMQHVRHAVCQTCSMSDIAMSVIGAMSDIHMSDSCHAGKRYVWLIEHSRQALTLHIAHIWALWLSISLVKPFWASNSVETWLLETWQFVYCFIWTAKRILELRYSLTGAPCAPDPAGFAVCSLGNGTWFIKDTD